MNYEVVVVGGGIGGLTAAALLAARGLNVCVFERQSTIGGCVATVEHQGLQFEPTFGLYSGWEPGGIYERLFSELKCDPPAVRPLSPAYAVRLPGGLDTPAAEDLTQLEEMLIRSFPVCADAAIQFYRELTEVEPAPDAKLNEHVAFEQLQKCSAAFRQFIDAQLQTFVQRSVLDCTITEAAIALKPQRYWSIENGAQTLADALARSIKASGGSVRLNTPVLRLAYGADGSPAGVDLLSGERVLASRAVISNLTVWDTYGKLIGLNHVPAGVSSQLRKLSAWGIYQIFLTIDRSVVANLPAQRILAVTEPSESLDPEDQSILSMGTRGDAENLPATLSTFTPAEDWFSFHEDHEAHEAQDQTMLEKVWSRLHAAMPELGEGVEVIETATPQTFYESTRRKFGMIGRPDPNAAPLAASLFNNLYLVSDTVSPPFGLAGLATRAMEIADLIKN